MELLDNGNLGTKRLTQRETSCYHWQRNHQSVIGVRRRPGKYANVRTGASTPRRPEAMGVALSDINRTNFHRLRRRLVNNFLDEHRCISRPHAVPYVAG
ncbi:hypothetical protein ACNKHM_13980 [Shigella sonnei]